MGLLIVKSGIDEMVLVPLLPKVHDYDYSNQQLDGKKTHMLKMRHHIILDKCGLMPFADVIAGQIASTFETKSASSFEIITEELCMKSYFKDMSFVEATPAVIMSAKDINDYLCCIMYN